VEAVVRVKLGSRTVQSWGFAYVKYINAFKIKFDLFLLNIKSFRVKYVTPNMLLAAH